MEQQLAEAEETGGLTITPGQLHGDDDTADTKPHTGSSHVVIDAHGNSLAVAQVLAGEYHSECSDFFHP